MLKIQYNLHRIYLEKKLIFPWIKHQIMKKLKMNKSQMEFLILLMKKLILLWTMISRFLTTS